MCRKKAVMFQREERRPLHGACSRDAPDLTIADAPELAHFARDGLASSSKIAETGRPPHDTSRLALPLPVSSWIFSSAFCIASTSSGYSKMSRIMALVACMMRQRRTQMA